MENVVDLVGFESVGHEIYDKFMSEPASSSSLISKVMRSGCLQNSSKGATDNPTKINKIKLIATIAFYQQN